MKHVLVFLSIAFAAQSFDASAQTIDCTLRPVVSTEANQGRWAAPKQAGGKPLVLTFSEFDTGKSRAKMTGNAATVEVYILEAQSRIDLLEITPTGNKMLTTLSPTAEGKWLGVHSRHSIILRDMLPSQYVGECEKRG